MIRLLVPMAMLIALAACEREPAGEAGDGSAVAEGEVLGGTISDAMIPLEELRSEAPLVPRAAPAPTAGDGAGDEAEAASAAPAPESSQD
ncbi:MAG: hypothetical protein ACXIT4_00640 [Erythrobacter sp.]